MTQDLVFVKIKGNYLLLRLLGFDGFVYICMHDNPNIYRYVNLSLSEYTWTNINEIECHICFEEKEDYVIYREGCKCKQPKICFSCAEEMYVKGKNICPICMREPETNERNFVKIRKIESPSNEEYMQIFVKGLKNRLMTLQVRSSFSMDTLFYLICEIVKTSREKIRIIFNGRQLQPYGNIAEWNIQEESTLNPITRLCGD